MALPSDRFCASGAAGAVRFLRGVACALSRPRGAARCGSDRRRPHPAAVAGGGALVHASDLARQRFRALVVHAPLSCTHRRPNRTIPVARSGIAAAGARPWRRQRPAYRRHPLPAVGALPAARRVSPVSPRAAPRHAARFYRAGSKVRAVPDPVYPLAPGVDGDNVLADSLPRGRVALLLFGHLTERKGTLTLLESLRLVPEHVAARPTVILAGKVDPAIADRVAALRQQLDFLQPNLVLTLVDRRLSTGEIGALVARADAVLAPYQRFVGSSGVLLWAARAGKPLLTQDFGLIGPLVRRYRLGLAVESDQHEALAAGIVRIVQEGPDRFIDPQEARRFVLRNAPDRCAALVFGRGANAGPFSAQS